MRCPRTTAGLRRSLAVIPGSAFMTVQAVGGVAPLTPSRTPNGLRPTFIPCYNAETSLAPMSWLAIPLAVSMSSPSPPVTLNEVAGMVLIDSTDRAADAKTVSSLPAVPGAYNAMGRVSVLVSTSARLGLARLYAPLEDVHGLPQRSGEEVRANIASPGNLSSTIDEYVQANNSMEEAASLRNFAGKPLVVLTAGIANDTKHQAAQNELATLSTNTVHRTIDRASHEALVADQGGAAITSQSILDVVSSVRNARPLAKRS